MTVKWLLKISKLRKAERHSVLPVLLIFSVLVFASSSTAGAQASSTPGRTIAGAASCPTGGTEQTGNRASAQIPVYESWYFYLALMFVGITLTAHRFLRLRG